MRCRGESRVVCSAASYQGRLQHSDLKDEIVLHISADGSVTGRAGGAELSECVVEVNRGWFARLLHIKDDFIIRGKIIGAVAVGSESGTNTINAPFNLPEGRIKGTMFITHPLTYPYPFLSLRLSREP